MFRPLIEGRWVKSASLALLKDGRSLLCILCSFGSTGDASSSLASPDTLYEIGSLTKLFTGLLLAEQSERGAVRLDDPVSQLLPVPLRSAGRPITLLDLATQRSGLPRLPSNLAPRDPQNPYADYDDAQLLAFLRGVEPAPAGAQYQYSNLGAALLGDALSRRARKSYPALVREHMLTPLDMTDTHFAVPPGKERRVARGHDVDDAPRPAWDVDVFAPAVGLRSTARDMAKFLAAALPEARTPLSSAFVTAQAARADAGGGRRIGFFFQTRPDGSVWHNGRTGGFASYFAVDPASRQESYCCLYRVHARGRYERPDS